MPFILIAKILIAISESLSPVDSHLKYYKINGFNSQLL